MPSTGLASLDSGAELGNLYFLFENLYFQFPTRAMVVVIGARCRYLRLHLAKRTCRRKGRGATEQSAATAQIVAMDRSAIEFGKTNLRFGEGAPLAYRP
jgi:hypothetical protein